MKHSLSTYSKTTFKLTLAALGLVFASAANAALVYEVSDTSVNNCSAHGLWTGTSLDRAKDKCANYFSISGYLTIEDDQSSARLTATALNREGVQADIDLQFTQFEETYSYKKEGGVAWNPSLDTANDIDFFTAISGVITLTDNSIDTDYIINGLAGGYGLQYGLGANAKDPNALGASAWILGQNLGSHHWDLNVNLTAVPEPSSLGMLSVALLAGLARRRRSVR